MVPSVHLPVPKAVVLKIQAEKSCAAANVSKRMEKEELCYLHTDDSKKAGER
jgi:hypothetical protein